MDSSGRSEAGGTRSLLTCGMLAGPIYLAVGIAQGLLRDGFDFERHPLSVLANGPGGWVQTANFVVTGLLVVSAAVGLQRVLRATSRATGIFLGAFGVSMLVAAVCPADPMDGFPVGTPLGVPTSMSTLGLLHFAAGGLGFVALAVACSGCLARHVASRRTWARTAVPAQRRHHPGGILQRGSPEQLAGARDLGRGRGGMGVACPDVPAAVGDDGMSTSKERPLEKIWRRGWDSNPRYGHPYT